MCIRDRYRVGQEVFVPYNALQCMIRFASSPRSLEPLKALTEISEGNTALRSLDEALRNLAPLSVRDSAPDSMASPRVHENDEDLNLTALESSWYDPVTRRNSRPSEVGVARHMLPARPTESAKEEDLDSESQL
eukprot:TRINITY_DN8672_c0_g1_i2.p2 TRINITY_DN8672_c0_g1~~TRINITY_DN8672_c0_g1_i2.p2  ORF type:complete len:134 (-),score=12.27 TRINITY_DN8672_c0_g1_i2:71-472(-)